jgi:hypothetical protein
VNTVFFRKSRKASRSDGIPGTAGVSPAFI